MKKAIARLLLACACFAAMGTHAESGNDIYSAMTSSKDFQNIFAYGYIHAIADAGAGGTPVDGFRFCSPQNVTYGQAGDIAKNWLERHPELRHYAAPGLIAKALEDAFPCDKK